MMTTATMKESVQATATRQGFKQITGNTGVALFVSDKGANHANSMKTLEDANLRPLARQEALPLLMRDEALKNALKGKWFYVAGVGMEKGGLFTINYMGELVDGADKVSLEERVNVWKGTNPLSLVVHSDFNASLCGRRFVLRACAEPDGVAPVVVGVAKDFKLELKPETAPKIAPELRASVEASVANVEAAEQAGALVAGTTAPLKELLRVLN